MDVRYDADSGICWAREDEIEGLALPIRNSVRSVMILYGDSGIGKSTVLNELRYRLLVYPHLLLGFHEASSADHDPLLSSVDNLLRQALDRAGAVRKIRDSCMKLAGRLRPGFREFLLNVSNSMFYAGVARFAKAALPSLASKDESISGLETSGETISAIAEGVHINALPQFSRLVFADLLEVLRLACPDETFVFILDDFDSVVSAAGEGTPAWSSVRAVEEFLSHEFRKMRALHFLFAWKISQATSANFARFERVVRQYGGESRELRHISNRVALAEWLSTEVPRFKQLAPDDQSTVLAITGGLPEIIVKWRESGISLNNIEVLKRVAEDIRTGRYAELQQALEDSPVADRRAILSLALVPHPFATGALAELTGGDPQNVLDILRSWESRQLLQRVGLRRGQIYVFRNDQKRKLTLDCLPATLTENGKTVVGRAYEFLLSTFSLLDGGPEDDSFCSPVHLIDALLLASVSEAVDLESADIPRMRALLHMALAWERPRKAPAWLLPQGWPPSLQAWFLDLSLATGYAPPEQVLKELGRWASQAHKLPATPSRGVAEAAAWMSLAGRFEPQLRAGTSILPRVRQLRQAFPDVVPLAALCATANLNILISYFRIDEPANIKPILEQISEIYGSFPQDASLAQLKADALATTLAAYAITGNYGELQSLVDDLRHLRSVFPDRPLIARSLTKGLSNLIGAVVQQQHLAGIDELLAEVREILVSAANPEALAEETAIAISNALRGYCNAHDMQGVETLLDEVRNLGSSFPHLIRIRIIRAMDLSMAIAAWSNLKQMEAVDSHLKELRDLQAATPEAPSIAPWLAEGLENTILAQINTAGSTNVGQIERINDLLSELRRLHRKLPTNDNITDHLAAGIAWAVGAHGNIRSGHFEPLLKEIKGMYRKQPQRWLACQLALALNHGMWACINLGYNEAGDRLRSELQRLANKFPDLTFGRRRPTSMKFMKRGDENLSSPGLGS